MRKLRFGALAASAALASVTVLGAGTAMAQEGDAPEPVTVTSPGNYTMTATAIGECKVEFTLESDRPDNSGNWRGDFRIGEEDPIVSEDGGSRGDVYRPVVGSNEGIVKAIENNWGEDAYDFAALETTVDLRDSRIVPYADGDPNKGRELAGAEPTEDGEYEITFGVYQGPVAAGTTDVYNLNGALTVTGCTTPDPEPTLPERISSELNLPDFSELSSNLSS